tara:strand:- start:298 stop:480 length:183 start_codon:yes stop_codon:yes gene_type:complete
MVPLYCHTNGWDKTIEENQILAKILQDLMRHKLLVSFEGRRGGFNLLRSTRPYVPAGDRR